ncbi:MAG: hypothetical protein AABW63_03570 [Nanoarchaeota archaeon]
MTNSTNKPYSPRSEVIGFIERVLKGMDKEELVRLFTKSSRGIVSSVEEAINAVKEGTSFGRQIYGLAEQKYNAHPRKRGTSLNEPFSKHYEND